MRRADPQLDERIRRLWGQRRLVPLTCAQIAEKLGISERRVRKAIANQLAAVATAQKGASAVDPILHGQSCATNVRVRELMGAPR